MPGVSSSRKFAEASSYGVVAIAVPVTDRVGAKRAQLNGVFIVSPQILARAQGRLGLAALTAAAIVFVTTLLIYPMIRRLVRRLERLVDSTPRCQP
jgi:hypothetical protein